MSQDETMDYEQLKEVKNLKNMLEFETQIFLDIIHNDGLLIGAKGLNLELVLINLLKVYADPGNLIFILNANEREEKYYKEHVQNENIHSGVNETGTSDRMDIYLSGGIHFVSTRILVLDMLKKRLPFDKITGIIVLRAHKIVESCQEAFILRLYRKNNKTGFVKAFSNSALSFTMGFGHVERVMRALFVKELYIWPRFHSLVINTLKNYEPQLIELHVPISENMKKIQSCILELMNLTVKELKRINKTIELEEITTENCLTKKFHKILQSQLDLVWHQLGQRSKKLIADLKCLRHLIITMIYYDPITFYNLLSGYRKTDYAKNSEWVFLKPADLLFSLVKNLIYTGDNEFNPELCPKWETLLEILNEEIPKDIKKNKDKDNKILILCSDNKTCFQLNHLLTNGPHYFLTLTALKHGIPMENVHKNFQTHYEKLTKFKNHETLPKKAKIDQNKEEELEQKDDDDLNEEQTDFKNLYILTMSQSQNIHNESRFEPCSQFENLNLTQLIEEQTQEPTIIIQTFKGGECYVNLETTLEIIKPSYIILYQCNVTSIREIELYEAHRNKDKELKIYFLLHAGTVEEQSYLTSLRREKEAFEHLIETKSVMVIPDDQDGKTENCMTLQETISSPTKSTRQGGNQEQVKKQYIIVDMREFRSELPVLIHKRGLELEPLTITVGDYILTPDICVERKSISDLIMSLKSGRLYQQCTQMSRYYTKPMLLIEFDQNKPFSWQNYKTSLDGNTMESVQQRLLLLTIHFPKLRIIWSPNPYATAQLFEELKQNKEDPNIEYAVSIGGEQDLDVIETKYNSAIYDFVRKLPGINSKNIDVFLRKGKNMDVVAKMSEEQLKNSLGNSLEAGSLYSILNDELVVEEDSSSKIKGKGKKRNFK